MVFALILLIVLTNGCAAKHSTDDFSGKYLLSVDGGADSIILNPDNTYNHIYVTKSGEKDQQDGTWTVEELEAGTTVVLTNFRSLHKEDIHGEGIYMLLVKRIFGELYLITNIDLNEGYKKQT
ncbi:hypothetical protein HC024_11260 [Methylococcaceae bacterium WWC4]|nr:hypothetical protein [Methylococcaceae bacterium WWC4]